MSAPDVELIEAENARKAVEDALRLLGEHFGAVQILASHETEKGETVMAALGYGNWYARQGMAHEFLDTATAENFAWEINKAEDDEDEQ